LRNVAMAQNVTPFQPKI